MAALSKNGTEIARFEHRYNSESDGAPCALFYSVRSTGVILKKLKVIINGRAHDYGWKRAGKIRAGMTVEDAVRSLEAKGLTRVYGEGR